MSITSRSSSSGPQVSGKLPNIKKPSSTRTLRASLPTIMRMVSVMPASFQTQSIQFIVKTLRPIGLWSRLRFTKDRNFIFAISTSRATPSIPPRCFPSTSASIKVTPITAPSYNRISPIILLVPTSPLFTWTMAISSSMPLLLKWVWRKTPLILKSAS